MIYVFTRKVEDTNWIMLNDLYFNLNTGNEEFGREEVNAIQAIDNARLTEGKHIVTKYGVGTIRDLSSGCKTLLNIIKHPKCVVNVEECGPNVLEHIFSLARASVYMSRPILFNIPDDCLIMFDNRDTVTGRHGFDAWWSAEYARREHAE